MTHLLCTSPRFSIRSAPLAEVVNSIETIGHCVLDDVWNTRYMEELRINADRYFSDLDKRYATDADGMSYGERAQYHGHFAGTHYVTVDDRFQEELERTGLTVVLRKLFEGDFVSAESHRVFRRVDPGKAVSVVGLHKDFQLDPQCKAAYRKPDLQVTVWSPVVDVTGDAISRLLLMKSGFDLDRILGDEDYVTVEGVRYPSIGLRQVSVLDEAKYPDFSNVAKKSMAKVFATGMAYAPEVPLGSCVIFTNSVWHGSYIPEHNDRRRMSIDFRVVGDYRVSRETWNSRGVLFSTGPKPSNLLLNLFERWPRELRQELFVSGPVRARAFVNAVFNGLLRRAKVLVGRLGRRS